MPSLKESTIAFIGDHITPSTGHDIKLVWVDPAPASALSREFKQWMSLAEISPTRVPGYWMDAPGLESTPAGAPPTTNEKIIYHLHGGAYGRA